MMKTLLLVPLFLLIGGCAVESPIDQDAMAANIVSASRFSEYGYRPIPKSKYSDRGFIYKSGPACDFFIDNSAALLDSLYIYDNSNYVATHEKEVFQRDRVRKLEFIAFKQDLEEKSYQAKSHFLKILEIEGNKVYKDLMKDIKAALEEGAAKDYSIVFEKSNMPNELKNCSEIQDISSSIVSYVNDKP